MTAVHQLLPVYSVGDAIGGAVLRTRDILRRAGFDSDVFADLWDHRLEASPVAELPLAVGTEDAVLYHLSIGSPVAEAFAALAARRVVVYHNITPTAAYEGTSEEVAHWLDRGRLDLRMLVPLADLVVAVSAFNLAECLPLRPAQTAVVPVPVDVARLRPRPARPAQPPRILAVGRIAPNKRIDTLLRALCALRGTTGLDARLAVVGGSHDTATLLAHLRALAEDLGVAAAVEMTGTGIDDAALGDEYARAAVLAVASEHEGFCVPVLEAMAFGVPVVARDAAAVPETLGGAGLVVPGEDPLLWAACLERAIGDADLRATLADRDRRRLADFAPAAVERRLLDALAGAGISP